MLDGVSVVTRGIGTAAATMGVTNRSLSFTCTPLASGLAMVSSTRKIDGGTSNCPLMAL